MTPDPALATDPEPPDNLVKTEHPKPGWGPFWTPEDDERLYSTVPELTTDEITEQIAQGLNPKDDRELAALKARVPGHAVIQRRLKLLGVVHPIWLDMTCTRQHIPRSLGAAVLFQESGGGWNVYGHDPTIYIGAGKVTHRNYTQGYKPERVRSGNRLMQGVGGNQLTWWSIQDAADGMGGCWHPYWNMTEGWHNLHASIKDHGWVVGIQRYNGSGPAAVAYERAVTARQQRFYRYLVTGHW